MKKIMNEEADESIDFADLDDISFRKEEKQLPFYADIECERSYYVFHKANNFRIFCYKISMHRYFEKVILTLIFFSSMKLVYDTYILDLDEDSLEI